MNIFEFTDFREYMKFQFARRPYAQAGGVKKKSLVKLAKSLGYSSPSLISMVMNGKRAPSEDLCESLLDSWGLSLKEREYFRLLVSLDRKRRAGDDPAEIIERIRRLVGNRAVYVFPEQEFSLIREWHFLVIKLLVESPGFREDPDWISKMLRKRITPAQAAHALERLEEMGAIQRDPETQKLRPVSADTETTHDIPSSAIRIHQKGMINRALEAIDDRPVEERQFNTLTFHVDPVRLPEAKKHILEFMRWVHSEFANPGGDSIFQLNLQFFEHTALGAKVRKKGSYENN